MEDFATELRRQADSAIAAARDATLAARTSHARAELMRHMLTTAAKVKDRPARDAIAFVLGEWLAAWGQDPTTCPQKPQMEALAAACQAMARAPGTHADTAVRHAFAALEAAYAAAGTTLADQMAWRSSCAHGWWGDVRPAPAAGGYATIAQRADSLWERGCAPHCR